MCITVDMQSGEIVFLNDFIDVNEGYFYLEEGKVFFRGTGSDPNFVNRILIKDIEDYLKVPEW